MGQSPSESVFRLGAVILAAGRSTRMGQSKLLLPWGKTSILGHLIQQWRELSADQIAVVCAAGDRIVYDELQRLNFLLENRIENPVPELGMFSSIQCAARWRGWKSALTHWVIVLGDQPHLRRQTLEAILKVAATRPRAVVQPARAGHRKHPVLMPKDIFIQLATSTKNDLKEFLVPHEVAICDSDDPGLEVDIDRPEDYVKALSLWNLESSQQHRSSETSIVRSAAVSKTSRSIVN